MDCFGDFRQRGDVSIRTCQLECRPDDGERASFCKVVGRLTEPSQLGWTLWERLGGRLRPRKQDRRGDLLPAHLVGVTTDGEFG
ncbi:Uncharacterised protein [Mycobacterium tuberculosis]|nr:Uncharacterised protein [Mycobacterium tuberculosis]